MCLCFVLHFPPRPNGDRTFRQFMSTARDWRARNRNLNSTNQRLIETNLRTAAVSPHDIRMHAAGAARTPLCFALEGARESRDGRRCAAPTHLVAVMRLQSPFLSKVCLTFSFSLVLPSVFCPFDCLIATLTGAEGLWFTPLLTVCMVLASTLVATISIRIRGVEGIVEDHVAADLWARGAASTNEKGAAPWNIMGSISKN